MSDSHSARGSSPGFDPHDGAAARLDAQHHALRDIADWFEKASPCAPDAICTLTATLFCLPHVKETAQGPSRALQASCRWTVSVACPSEPTALPTGKTSAFGPSSRFTLLNDQYYEAAGMARGENALSQDRACGDAQKRARHQEMESAAKAGLCDRDDSAMQFAISYAPPRPAILGEGRYSVSAFEAVCDWNLIIQAISPVPAVLQSPDFAAASAAGSHP